MCSANLRTRAETIIRTNQLVGYQSTSRCQYYEIGKLLSCVYHHIAGFTYQIKAFYMHFIFKISKYYIIDQFTQ